jgi:hypothetical protein
MRLLAKRNLGFRNQDTNQIVTVRALSLEEVPDWVQLDPMFNWAVAAGDIVLGEPKDEAIDKSDVINDEAVDTAESGNHPESLTSEELDGKSKDELIALAAGRGVKVTSRMKADDIKAALLGVEESEA